jgi:hypothetical protein
MKNDRVSSPPLASRHQKGKRLKEVQAPRQLLIILCLIVVIGDLLIIIVIIVIVRRSIRGAHAKGSQLSRSQGGIGVDDRWIDGHVGELKKRLIPLIVNDLLVAVDNQHALLYHIQTLIYEAAHVEDTLEHLQESGDGARGGVGTTTVGSVSRSHSWRRRRSAMSPWILGNCGAKRLMCNVLVKFLMSHHLNHALNVGSKSTRSLRVYGNVPYLIHDVVKHIKPFMLHESI